MDISIFVGLGIGAATFLIIGLFHPGMAPLKYVPNMVNISFRTQALVAPG